MRKKEKWNKVISLGLVAVLTVTLLGGCGNQAGNAGTGGESEADAAASGEQAQGEDLFDFASVSDVVFPLKEKLNLTVFVKSIATGGGTYQDNYVTDWIEEKTNIHLDFVYDLDGDEAKTKLNLLMTDPDSIPDILWTTGWTKAETQSYGQQGLILPLNDYLEDAPNWNKLNESSPARRADLVLSDGNIYTYGDENECFHCLYDNRMWIYKPWVDSLNGGKMPETLDELYDFLVKVKTQDPNGNGKADEIPVSGYLGGWTTDPTVWFINSFLQCDNPLSNTTIDQGAGMVVNADGKIEYAVMKEEYRDALRFLNKIYEEGLVDSQVFTQDGTQFSATMENEENLVALHPGGTMSPEIGKLYGREDGKWQDWEVLEPVEGPNGVRLAARGRSLYFGSAVGIVSKNCKYPVIALALFDFLASEEGTLVQAYGPEGFSWEWTDEGVSLAGDAPVYENLGFSDDDENPFDWLGNGFEKEYANWHYASDASFRCNTVDFRSELKVTDPDYDVEYILQQAAEKYEKYAPDEKTLVPELVFEGQDAQTISEATVTIVGYVNQAAVQFITGDLDIEKDWDAYLQKLGNMGVDNFISLYQSYYDKYVENNA